MEYSTPEWLSQLSLPAVAAAFAGVMAVIAIVRGILRLIRTMLALAIGFAAGTYVFLHAPEWLHGVWENPSGKVLAALSVIGGAVGHLGSGFLFGKLLGGLDTAQAAGHNISKTKAAFISLLPSGVLMWLGGIFLRLTGSLSGMEHIDEGKAASPPWLSQARAVLSQGAVGKFFNFTDPVTSPEVTRLCEILVTYRDSSRWQNVRRDPVLSSVLNHPKFRRLLDDREVRHAVAHSNYARLFTLPEVREAAADPDLAKALRSLPAPEIRRAELVE